jgi:5-methyltetrahydrofolate--homocysteine methyltransferase
MDKKLKVLYTAVLEGERTSVRNQVQALLMNQYSPQLLLTTMSTAMNEVGERFEKGEYFIPEMLIAARAMQEGMDHLRPLLSEPQKSKEGVVVIATVRGDLHDIGKNLVAMLLEGAGFKVIDLGVDVSSEQIIQAIQRYNPNIVALSALLTTTMPGLKIVIDKISAVGLRQQVKIMVGGAPVTDDFAKKIGADGFSIDAVLAVNLAKQLMLEINTNKSEKE